MTNNPPPKQMARRIADARYSSSERPGSWMVAYDAALAAIIETTELAAAYARSFGEISIADNLRSGSHLKGSSDGR